MMRRRLIAALMVAAATATLQVATSAPSSAHDTSWQGVITNFSYAGYGRVTDNHMRVWARDSKADNKPAHTYYVYWHPGGFEAMSVISDTNGSGSGTDVSEPSPGPVRRFQVCVGHFGTTLTCSRWYGA